ncbi:MAG: ABC transporter permease, partial [Clostridiales bacterium]
PGAKSYQQWLLQLNTIYGLDCGVLEGFWHWIGQACRGNFGDSWYFNLPVTVKFTQVIGYSICLCTLGFFLELAVAIPLGMKAARRRYTLTDFALTMLALIGLSMPAFFFATLLKWIFAIELPWLPLFGAVSRYHQTYSPLLQFLDLARHFILPLITFVLVGVGGILRFTRANMLEVLDADYIRAARARGINEKQIHRNHALRNILLPLITIAGSALPGLFSGALLIETLFQIPGIGWTAYQAMVAGDIPFSMFYLLLIAALTLLGSLAADICYGLADPRVRIRGREIGHA